MRCSKAASPASADDFRSGLTPTYDYGALRAELNGASLAGDGAGIWRYARLLPVTDPAHRVSLGEGSTPVVELPPIAEALGVGSVWLKDESRNPTWSFKDRHAAVTVGKAWITALARSSSPRPAITGSQSRHTRYERGSAAWPFLTKGWGRRRARSRKRTGPTLR